MITEIYSLSPSDPNYDPNTLEIENSRDLLIAQIFMIFNTDTGEVLGDPLFGGSLENLLFEFNLNENQLSRKLEEQIRNYCKPEPEFNVKVSVTFFEGTLRDGAIIDVIINGEKSMGLFVK